MVGLKYFLLNFLSILLVVVGVLYYLFSVMIYDIFTDYSAHRYDGKIADANFLSVPLSHQTFVSTDLHRAAIYLGVTLSLSDSNEDSEDGFTYIKGSLVGSIDNLIAYIIKLQKKHNIQFTTFNFSTENSLATANFEISVIGIQDSSGSNDLELTPGE